MPDLFKALGRALGYDVVRRRKSSALLPQLETLLRAARPDLAVDVGANDGGFARSLRAAGFAGRIASFEPGAAAFAALSAAAAADPGWEAHRTAIGAREGRVTLNVQPGATDMASILPAGARLSRDFPRLAPARAEEVPLTTLDALAARGLLAGERLLLKTDTQGYDLEVLRGGAEVLRRSVAVVIELSVLPLYEGQPGYLDMLSHLEGAGFTLWGLSPVSRTREGGLIEFDAMMIRRGLVA